MSRDDFTGRHTIFYFFVALVGSLFCFMSKFFPLYDEATAEIIRPYSIPLVIFGGVLLVFSFLGLAFFCDAENDFLI